MEKERWRRLRLRTRPLHAFRCLRVLLRGEALVPVLHRGLEAMALAREVVQTMRVKERRGKHLLQHQRSTTVSLALYIVHMCRAQLTAMTDIRLTTNLDILQQTEPIENAINACRKSFSHAVRNRYSTFTYFFGLLLAWWAFSALLRTPTTGPAPDLLKVAGMAKSFEPAIYYSEHGYAQIESLQETGVAVWDLGESVRSTNMTSAPLITGQLDQLSDSLKSLAVELTKFFATVDADIDSILLVMDWAQRELSTLTSDPPSKLSSVSSNMHAVLLKTGLIGRGELIADLFGQTRPQRARAMLERTFGDFLGVLEEAISGELTHSMKLLAFFEAIEKQFLNLQRTVVREQDTQEREESDFLSSLWTKVIGANAGRLRKYEKNKLLLHSIRDRTVRNKHVLVEHNGRLTQLQSNLEILRQRLVSPLVRSNDSSTLSVEAQIAGLQGTYDELRSSRERQKSKMMELIYGAGNRRRGIDGYGYAIEGSSS